MKIKNISVSFRQTKQITQYEPVSLELTTQVEISEEDQTTLSELINKLFKSTQKQVEKRLEEIASDK